MSTVAYIVRTDTLKKEARIARLFRYLSRCGSSCTVVGITKTKDGFSFPHHEQVCWSDRLPSKWIRIPAKLFEMQFRAYSALRRHCRDADVIIIANYEFLILGMALRALAGKRVIVDLHEHYHRRIFRHNRLSQIVFLKIMSGVIFANKHRAEDFLNDAAVSDRVFVARNIPDLRPGRICTPTFTNERQLVVGIVGGALPGRYVQESISAIDIPEFSKVVTLRSFGTPLNVRTDYVSLIEHGRFVHSEILQLLGSIDGSLVFYDPARNWNNRLCEPNRFFEAYNTGKLIFCFRHPTLESFYDRFCYVVDRDNFAASLRENIRKACTVKNGIANDTTQTADRTILTFSDNQRNLQQLCD